MLLSCMGRPGPASQVRRPPRPPVPAGMAPEAWGRTRICRKACACGRGDPSSPSPFPSAPAMSRRDTESSHPPPAAGGVERRRMTSAERENRLRGGSERSGASRRVHPRSRGPPGGQWTQGPPGHQGPPGQLLGPSLRLRRSLGPPRTDLWVSGPQVAHPGGPRSWVTGTELGSGPLGDFRAPSH